MTRPFTLNLGGRLATLDRPRVMGILNLTPDSFYAASRQQTDDEIRRRTRQILDEGADIIDVGAYSTRPGAADVSAREEADRLRRGLKLVREEAPGAIVSVDTFRADVARMCVEEAGADLINDIGGGTLDDRMFATIARLGVPYVLMHMRLTPRTMTSAPAYGDVTREVLLFLQERIGRLHELGARDIIADPGFGFAKSLDDNYALMARLGDFAALDTPLLVGVSRKSMIYRLLDTTPEEALAGTTALHMAALAAGAHILRVHDVRQAVDCVRIHQAIEAHRPDSPTLPRP